MTRTFGVVCGTSASSARGSRLENSRLPALSWIATGLLIGGFACLVGGVLLIAIPLRKMS